MNCPIKPRHGFLSNCILHKQLFQQCTQCMCDWFFQKETCVNACSRHAICTNPHVRVKVGQAKNPGPTETHPTSRLDTPGDKELKTDNDIRYKLHIANVTNLLTNAYLLANRSCNAMMVSEHSIKQFQIPKVIEILGSTCKMSLSELDPEVSRNLGGVGIIDFDNKNIRKESKPQMKIGVI